MKTKVKYISICNILHLLSTFGPVPCAVTILASLVIESKQYVSFWLAAILSLNVFSCEFVHAE